MARISFEQITLNANGEVRCGATSCLVYIQNGEGCVLGGLAVMKRSVFPNDMELSVMESAPLPEDCPKLTAQEQ